MHTHRYTQVLQLDIHGTPQAWITLAQAATHVARGAVAWAGGSGPLAARARAASPSSTIAQREKSSASGRPSRQPPSG